MSRILSAIIAGWLALPVFATQPTPPIAESFLHLGKFAEGEVALLLALDANPADDEVRFGLGVTQFLRAVENFGQSLYEYGAANENTNIPLLRLPVPKNDKPSTISYRELGRVLDSFATDLGRAEATLAAIKDDNVKLRLGLANIQLDFTGNKDRSLTLLDLLKQLNNGQQFDFQKRTPDFKIHFDRGDVAWLRAYCHLLSAMVNTYRAIDEEAGFEQRVKGVFPKIEVSSKAALAEWIDGLSISDGPRLRRARLQLLSVCELNHETWRHIRQETDDDFEWLSNSKQTDQLGLPISDRQIDAWLSMITEMENLLSGKSLIPGELLVFFGGESTKDGRGLNVQKLLDNPPTDLLNVRRIREKGIDDKYLESTKNKKPLNLELLFRSAQLFDGPFGFARAARMN